MSVGVGVMSGVWVSVGVCECVCVGVSECVCVGAKGEVGV